MTGVFLIFGAKVKQAKHMDRYIVLVKVVMSIIITCLDFLHKSLLTAFCLRFLRRVHKNIESNRGAPRNSALWTRAPNSPTPRPPIRRIARPATPRLSSCFNSRATHGRTILPAALASVLFGFVLVRVRVLRTHEEALALLVEKIKPFKRAADVACPVYRPGAAPARRLNKHLGW